MSAFLQLQLDKRPLDRVAQEDVRVHWVDPTIGAERKAVYLSSEENTACNPAQNDLDNIV